ncbi:hypothetical protein GCM10011583_11820 [Streptomyces camponoticapitis]|uniref:Roadblock/LAMTOR2 domain-containing protein n=1 Tax=Streptomyces camponoticapitis TaxID=1616125 RepID=A0ABQ2DZF4_9ACTN|nr:hypothetical protein [Streptomyces camponoticapitis]GGJ81965.1 hypothetical protein GCM10011583_11820 [Streptomyces camponoticapitis]
MSDTPDSMMEAFESRLTTVYIGLVSVCENLPVPITLPTGVVHSKELVQTVRRVADIAEEQPMPEEQHAMLYTGAVMWLAAADLFGILTRTDYVEARAAGGLGILLIAGDSISELGAWLLDNEI